MDQSNKSSKAGSNWSLGALEGEKRLKREGGKQNRTWRTISWEISQKSLKCSIIGQMLQEAKAQVKSRQVRQKEIEREAERSHGGFVFLIQLSSNQDIQMREST